MSEGVVLLEDLQSGRAVRQRIVAVNGTIHLSEAYLGVSEAADSCLADSCQAILK